ncbi:response regulator [Brevirhabdus sp.]|uniref:response regulator n=1 Tax=Brevirhabdus sp. TaxID=2004514 RepID=UPI004059FF50
MTNLRERLSSDTRCDHERVDARFSALDLKDHVDYGRFLAAQRAAFCTILPLIEQPGGDEVISHIRTVVRAIDRDLSILGHDIPPPLSPVDITGLDALACAYILGGSRMGTRVLRRTWRQSPDPLVLSAGTYFGLDTDNAHWRAIVADLSARPATDARADRVVADARRIFGLFERAITQQAPTQTLLKGFALVVEDDRVIAMDMAAQLGDLGACPVETASTAYEVSAILERRRPAVVILDVMLGNASSLPIAQMLAAADIPFVISTGHSQHDAMIKQFPKAPIVSKPYDSNRLTVALRLALNHHARTQRAI